MSKFVDWRPLDRKAVPYVEPYYVPLGAALDDCRQAVGYRWVKGERAQVIIDGMLPMEVIRCPNCLHQGMETLSNVSAVCKDCWHIWEHLSRSNVEYMMATYVLLKYDSLHPAHNDVRAAANLARRRSIAR